MAAKASATAIAAISAFMSYKFWSKDLLVSNLSINKYAFEIEIAHKKASDKFYNQKNLQNIHNWVSGTQWSWLDYSQGISDKADTPNLIKSQKLKIYRQEDMLWTYVDDISNNWEKSTKLYFNFNAFIILSY